MSTVYYRDVDYPLIEDPNWIPPNPDEMVSVEIPMEDVSLRELFPALAERAMRINPGPGQMVVVTGPRWAMQEYFDLDFRHQWTWGHGLEELGPTRAMLEAPIFRNNTWGGATDADEMMLLDWHLSRRPKPTPAPPPPSRPPPPNVQYRRSVW